MAADPPFLTLALPVKDGAARLPEMFRDVESFVAGFPRSCEVVAVDDGSRDATAEQLAGFAAGRDWVRVLRHERNRGKGAALKTAVADARGTFVLAVDADATYPLESLDRFLPRLEGGGCDAVVGNRRDLRSQFILHPTAFAYIGWRHAVGGLFMWIVRGLFGLRVHDSQCGFKCFRTEVAKRRFPEVAEERFAFDVELLAVLQHHGHAIEEAPVVYVYRDQPTSLRVFRDGFVMLFRLLQIRRRLARLARAGPRSAGRGELEV